MGLQYVRTSTLIWKKSQNVKSNLYLLAPVFELVVVVVVGVNVKPMPGRNSPAGYEDTHCCFMKIILYVLH